MFFICNGGFRYVKGQCTYFDNSQNLKLKLAIAGELYQIFTTYLTCGKSKEYPREVRQK